jgi:hypothetical protein
LMVSRNISHLTSRMSVSLAEALGSMRLFAGVISCFKGIRASCEKRVIYHAAPEQIPVLDGLVQSDGCFEGALLQAHFHGVASQLRRSRDN